MLGLKYTRMIKHMPGIVKFSVIFITLFLSYALPVYSSDVKDSAIKVLSDISGTYKKRGLSEKEYLDTVYSTMNSLLYNGAIFTNKELTALLGLYRKVIWESGNEDHKRKYYAVFSNQAQAASRLGEMRYYAEKINEIEQKTNKHPSVTALTIIADYYNTLWSYNNTKDLYLANKSFILSFPRKAAREEFNLTQLVQSVLMLEKMGIALYELKDSLNGREVEAMMGKMYSIARQKYAGSNFELSHIHFSTILIKYFRGKGLNSRKVMWESISDFEKLRAEDNTPDNLKNAATFSIIDKKLILFLDEKNVDSAIHYIRMLEPMEAGPYDKYMIGKYKSRILYEQQHYKNGIDTLIAAMLISEEIRAEIVKDANEMMYAQAKSEEQKLLLDEEEARRKNTERQLFLISIAAAVLLVSGLLIVQYIRKRQRARFVEFKLNIARNLHDETNPALLYAQTLAKSSRTENTKTELEQHIGHTMEIIRSLSHDLKADRLNTIGDLIYMISGTLKKLNADNTFTYHIISKVNEKKFLSYHQFMHLKSILYEAITNTAKHAVFDTINVSLSIVNNKLSIIYSDNGTGWDESSVKDGIGIQNMAERMEKLNGDLIIRNNYPEGYQIELYVLLR